MRLVLVACGSSKLPFVRPARELYDGNLFRLHREYAEVMLGEPWLIMSAKHGLVVPERELEPYDQSLTQMTKAERESWSAGIQARLLEQTRPGDELIVLAGQLYYQGWKEALEKEGRLVKVLFERMPIGKRLAALKRELE